jgi:5-methylcytosine-specific restriction endonuclease McrA
MQSSRCTRNVSEREKKIVASSQKWCCKSCTELLNHTYEIDHIIPLYGGGSNDRSNLQALCANCHSLKTSYDLDLFGTSLRPKEPHRGKSPYFIVGCIKHARVQTPCELADQLSSLRLTIKNSTRG